MSKPRWKALVFGLVLTIALAAAFVTKRHCPCIGKRLIPQFLGRPYTPGSEVEFRWEMSASGKTPDGARFDDTKYLSSDCVKVTVTYYTYSSPGLAAEHLDSTIKRASVVYARNNTRDGKGNLTDQRVVLSGQPSALYAILHQNAGQLLRIESSSLNHAVEYEKRLGIVVVPAAN